MQFSDFKENFGEFISGLYNGYDMPKLTEDDWKEFWFLFNIENNLSLFREKSQADLYSSPFFTDLLQNFDNLINKKNQMALIVSSGHDGTIMTLMNALNMTSWKCQVQAWQNETIDLENCIFTYPGFAANMIFELWEKEDESHYVRLMYNGTYWPVCGKE